MDFSKPERPLIAAAFPGKTAATSVGFSDSGKRLFVASEDGNLRIIDCVRGKQECVPLRTDRELMRVLEPTHHEDCILFTGKGSPTVPADQKHSVHYWSTYDNKILRQFTGHSAQVTHLSICPTNDVFVSSSLDRTARLWDLKQAACVAKCQLPNDLGGPPVAFYDQSGLVLGISAPNSSQQGHHVHLYDSRQYNAGPFADFSVDSTQLQQAIDTQLLSPSSPILARGQWKDLSFNREGNRILINSDHGLSIVLDGFKGEIQRVIQSRRQSPAVACFSSDDRSLLTGNEDGSIVCYDLLGSGATTLRGKHEQAVSAIASNPEFQQLASCCRDTALWLW